MRRICFVTCRTWPEISESDRLVQRALEAQATVEARAWNAPDAVWEGFDAIVLRSNWDYHFEPDAFVGWLDRLERAGARVFNPPALVRWNLTKAYLLDLARAGVPTVATVILEDESRAGLDGGPRLESGRDEAGDLGLRARHAARERGHRGRGGGRARVRRHAPAGPDPAVRRGDPDPGRVVADLHRDRDDPRGAQAAGRRRIPGAAPPGRHRGDARAARPGPGGRARPAGTGGSGAR